MHAPRAPVAEFLDLHPQCRAVAIRWLQTGLLDDAEVPAEQLADVKDGAARVEASNPEVRRTLTELAGHRGKRWRG
jgi:hypothetical protein